MNLILLILLGIVAIIGLAIAYFFFFVMPKQGEFVGKWRYTTYPESGEVCWDLDIPNDHMAAFATHFTSGVLFYLGNGSPQRDMSRQLRADLAQLLMNADSVGIWPRIKRKPKQEKNSLDLRSEFHEGGIFSTPGVIGPMYQEVSKSEAAKTLVHGVLVGDPQQASLLRAALGALLTLHEKKGPPSSGLGGIKRAVKVLKAAKSRK